MICDGFIINSNNLTSFDGGRRSLSEARQIAADVSKYLAFANENSFDWKLLTSIQSLKKYIEKCEGDGK